MPKICTSLQNSVQALKAHTHTHPFNGPFSGTTQVSRYQKGKINLDFTEARDSEWQWHQLEHMQVCTSLQTDNHANTPPLSFLQVGCPSCRPTNSVKALKAVRANPKEEEETRKRRGVSKRQFSLHTCCSTGLAESNGSLLLGLWRDSLHVTCTPG